MTLADRLRDMPADQLRGMRRGIEKESLRAQPNGLLARTPHPAALGSALTHARITTDYSESQLELITGARTTVAACLDELAELHQFVVRTLHDPSDERLWVGSMPCVLPPDENIPIGSYGRSNIGRAKTVYRMGLAHRYGRRMQTISGIHYNWSLPGLSSDDYFALIRNFRRHAFVLLWLFGASPALCAGFVAGRDHGLQPLAENTLHLPHATSLRMGRLGYQSEAQSSLAVSYNGLEVYAQTLQAALTQPYAPYEAIGLRNLGGEYNQLATTLLQIENEFYGTIRPKRTIRSGERALHALLERGVEYVEVRCLDLDPFEPLGIGADTLRVLDVFLLHCLLSDSPPDDDREQALLARNQQRCAAQGREAGLMLEHGDGWRPLAEWATSLLADCRPIAEALDAAHGGRAHQQALQGALATAAQPDRLPSARLLATLQRDFDGCYNSFMRAQSEQTSRRILDWPWTEAQQAAFEAEARASHEARRALEAADSVDFETWRQAYLAPERLRPTQPA